VRHLASPKFWALYNALQAEIRDLADKNFTLLKFDPHHPSLHFKRFGELCSEGFGDHYRALGTEVREGIYWFWIGTHSEYDRIVG